MAREEMTNRWPRMALACLAVILLTALAVDAAVTRLKSMHATQSVVRPGATVEASVELSIPAPPGGVTVKLEHALHSRTNPDTSKAPCAQVYVPAEIFIPTGKTTGHFSIEVVQVSQPSRLIVTASLRKSEQVVTVHLVPR